MESPKPKKGKHVRKKWEREVEVGSGKISVGARTKVREGTAALTARARQPPCQKLNYISLFWL